MNTQNEAASRTQFAVAQAIARHSSAAVVAERAQPAGEPVDQAMHTVLVQERDLARDGPKIPRGARFAARQEQDQADGPPDHDDPAAAALR